MNDKRGQSLFEIIVALAIFSLIAATLISMAGGGFTALMLSGDQTNAAGLADGGIEAVRSIHDRAWNESHYDQSGVQLLSGEWRFLGEGMTEQIGKFLRTITFTNICRDATQAIVTCPGSYTDVGSRKVRVAVSWLVRPGVTDTVERVTYLTNWNSRDWIETTTSDFSDGTFSSTAATSTAGDADGAVILTTQ